MSRRPRRHHGDCPSCGSTAGSVAAINAEKKPVDLKVEPELTWQPTEITAAQDKDPDIGPVLERLRSGHPKPSVKELQSMSPLRRAVWAQFELLEVDNGVLKLKPETRRFSSSRIVLPEALLRSALERLHDGPEGGHLGQYKTLRKMQSRFWRPGLAGTVKDYCAACLTCGACKPPGRKAKAPLQPIPSAYPLQRVHIDIIGPLPKTKRGNQYILTVQCAFTKWVEAYALSNQKAKTCAQAIVNNWISRFGVPDSIHSDQGRNFESHLFSHLCEMLQIKKTRTTAYHPAGNGQVENINRTVKSLLKVRVSEEPERWDQHLGVSMMAYRSSIHASTGYTPFSLMFGREMRLPLDVMVGSLAGGASQNYGEFVTELKDSLSKAYHDTREHLQTAQQRQKEYFNKGVVGSTYNTGDLVFLHDPQLRVGEKAKFHRDWKGPYQVVDRVTEVNYKIKQPGCPNSRAKTVHFNNLKLYQRATAEPQEPHQSAQQPDPDMTPDAVCADEQRDDWVVGPAVAPSTGQPSRLPENQEETGDTDGPSPYPEPSAVQQLEPAPTRPDQTPLTMSEVQPSEQTPVEEDSEEDHQEEVPTRPQRDRKPPDRYGDWEFNSIEVRNTLETLVHRISDLERQREAQQRRIRRLKPHWLAEGRRLRQKACGQ